MDTCKQKDNLYNENKRKEKKRNVMPYFSNIRNYNSVFFFFYSCQGQQTDTFIVTSTIMDMMLH